MPELPEVETIKRQLQKVIVGKTITNVKVLRDKSFQGSKKNIIGKKVKRISRQAKVLIIRFTRRYPLLLIHLKMTGQLVYKLKVKSAKCKVKDKKIVGGHPTLDWINSLPSKHTRVIIAFADKSKLFFNDMRVFGWFKVVNNRAVLDRELNSVRGIEPLTKQFSVQVLAEVFKKTSRSIKLVLMDQIKIAGLGNIYTNDALFLAHIDPRREANSLSTAEIRKLQQTVNQVIKKGIELGGASDSDYIQLDGKGGNYQEHFLVYKREGKKCSKCSDKIVKIKLGGRGTYLCPGCQI